MENLVISKGSRVQADLRNSAKQTSSFTTETPAPSSKEPSFVCERVAHNVSMQLKDSDQIFSGDLGESYMHLLDE